MWSILVLPRLRYSTPNLAWTPWLWLPFLRPAPNRERGGLAGPVPASAIEFSQNKPTNISCFPPQSPKSRGLILPILSLNSRQWGSTTLSTSTSWMLLMSRPLLQHFNNSTTFRPLMMRVSLQNLAEKWHNFPLNHLSPKCYSLLLILAVPKK